jgi:hypothetical protein
MNCPYHPGRQADIPIPVEDEEQSGWLGWMEGCCGLVAWRCDQGELLPVEAQFCTFHGCERPRVNRVAHEWSPGDGQPRRVRAPSIIQRALELAPMGDGRSTPCLAGNVLVYLTDSGRLVAVDAGGEATLFLAAQVKAAALRLEGGTVIGALQTDAGVRCLSWEVRDLRDGLRRNGIVQPTPVKTTSTHLLGLPRDRTKLYQGSGPLRLIVEHDPIEDEDLLATYQKIAGVSPGSWVIARTPNPDGPTIYHPHLRPQHLNQVPVAVIGGVLVLGTVRTLAGSVAGALLIPNVGRLDAAA